MIGFTEPLAIVAYVLRAFRLRRIFDAQLYYFQMERKPTEMIERFKENRLIRILIMTVCILSVIYCGLALTLMYAPDDHDSYLFLLPTIDTAAFTEGTSIDDA